MDLQRPDPSAARRVEIAVGDRLDVEADPVALAEHVRGGRQLDHVLHRLAHRHLLVLGRGLPRPDVVAVRVLHRLGVVHTPETRAQLTVGDPCRAAVGVNVGEPYLPVEVGSGRGGLHVQHHRAADLGVLRQPRRRICEADRLVRPQVVEARLQHGVEQVGVAGRLPDRPEHRELGPELALRTVGGGQRRHVAAGRGRPVSESDPAPR